MAEEDEAEENRLRDLCLVLRREETGETLLCAGGRWDAVDRRWLKQEPEAAHFVECQESQVPFLRWGARWLHDFRSGHEVPGWVRQIRTRAVLAESGRRAGKTYAVEAFQWAVAVDIPLLGGAPLICWAIHVSHEEEEEYFDNLQGDKAIVPASWYRWRERRRRFDLVHGSYVQLISSDTPETTKRGKVDIAFVNEAQKQRQKALTNLLYGIADRAGLALLAANPNDSLTGEWVARLREKVLAGKLPRAESFYFDPSKNKAVDQEARSDVHEIVQEIDPKQAARDGGGAWLPLQDKAYYRWSDDRHLRPVPQLGDVTNAWLRKKLGSCSYQFIAGLDFQANPGCCASIFKLFGDINRPMLQAVGEVLIERGSEYVLSDALYDEGYEPDDLLLIADATGQQQDYEHRPGQDSYSKLRARGWHVEAPQKKRSTKGKHSVNPPIGERLKLTNEFLGNPEKGEPPRLLIDPDRAPMLAHCFRECILRPGRYSTRIPGGEGWLPHHTDGAGYVIYWIEPPPRRPVKAGGAPPVPMPRPGAGWWPT